MLKIFKKNFTDVISKLPTKVNKYIEIKIENPESSNYRLANFVRNKYDVKWDIIQKAIRKKDIFILRKDSIIRKSDEKIVQDDKIFICKYVLNIFDKKEEDGVQTTKLITDLKETKIRGINIEKGSMIENDLNTNKNISLRENENLKESNNEYKPNKEDNNTYKENNKLQNAHKNNVTKPFNLNKVFLEDYFDPNNFANITKENTFLLNMFKDMILYASNLFLVIDKKYNIASQRGSYLKFSIDDCLKILNENYPSNFNLKLVHRLDRNVSGLMIIGNNIDFVRKIGEDMKQSNISKTYICICQNIPKYFKELINEKRIHISRIEHFKETLIGNIFSDESCNDFSVLTKNGYSFEKNINFNNQISNTDESVKKDFNTKNIEVKEFELKKLSNFAYSKIISKITMNNNIKNIDKTEGKNTEIIGSDNYTMQGSYRITHFIYKDIGEGKGNNFIAFDLDKIDLYDEETVEKFKKFLDRLKLNSNKTKLNLPNKEENDTLNNLSISNKSDENKSLKELMKKQIKINKKEKLKKTKEIKDFSNSEDEFYTVVAYELISGKKHQIRKHMSKCFFTPIFNDEEYFFNNNISYIGYKYYLNEIEKYKNSLQSNNDINLIDKKEEDSNKTSKAKIKFPSTNNFEEEDLYNRYNIDDYSKGIMLNSFQIKMNNNLSDLAPEKVQFYNKNSLVILKSSRNDIIFQKRNLSNNFICLLKTLGVSHVTDYFANIRKSNLL